MLKSFLRNYLGVEVMGANLDALKAEASALRAEVAEIDARLAARDTGGTAGQVDALRAELAANEVAAGEALIDVRAARTQYNTALPVNPPPPAP